jgi:hypothetical protein
VEYRGGYRCWWYGGEEWRLVAPYYEQRAPNRREYETGEGFRDEQGKPVIANIANKFKELCQDKYGIQR